MSSPPLLEVRELAWTPPGEDEPLWEGASFGLDPGELAVLQGPSGAGKSTLLRTAVFLEKPSAGQVFWRGEAVKAERVRRFRHAVMYVQQSPVGIAMRVEENLAFPREMSRALGDGVGMDEAEQRALLARFGLEDLDVSRRFEELSVGQQQRVALVRCLSVRPEVLLLDEPTASLDEESARAVEEYIREYVEAGGAGGAEQTKGTEGTSRAALWITHSGDQRDRLGGRVLELSEIARLRS